MMTNGLSIKTVGENGAGQEPLETGKRLARLQRGIKTDKTVLTMLNDTDTKANRFKQLIYSLF